MKRERRADWFASRFGAVGAGALAGLFLYLLVVGVTLIRLILNPFDWGERITGPSVLWMIAFSVIFAAGGALAGALLSLRLRALRFPLIGAIAGALLFSCGNATWTLTTPYLWFMPTQRSVAQDALTGAGFGALGGILALALVWWREQRRGGE